MVFLRPISRAAAAVRPCTTAFRPLVAQQHQVRFATGDYGSGDGNPISENPQAQGKRGREDLEHPGPAPPKAAKEGSGSKTSSSSSNKSDSKGAEKSGESKKGAQPKILNENPPTEENASEDVKAHNRDMDRRAEKAHEQVSNEEAEKDKVPSKFWSGQGGRDREP